MLRFILLPFSILFGIITFVRNKLYDWKLFTSVSYDDLTVISVGNITAGGTGKTPFVEYLIRMLSQNCRIAVLSRGYKRRTKGYILAGHHTSAAEIGDEPYQIWQKFDNIAVAADADRVNGISKIRSAFPDIQVILLDDAFQYRKIRPALSILLVDYSRQLYRDSMLPGGRLRECPCFARRADVIVVTKTPAGISSEERHEIERHYARAFPHGIFFSTIRYCEPVAVFTCGTAPSTGEMQHCDVLLVTGIASNRQFADYVRSISRSVHLMTFPDHHAFSDSDAVKITEMFDRIPSSGKILLTTEKDAVRMQQIKLPEHVARRSCFIPIEVCFADECREGFERRVAEAVNRLRATR